MYKRTHFHIKRKSREPLNYTQEYCPLCRKRLVIRINRSTQEKFVGCSGFPKCKYIKKETVIDYACEVLGVTWRPNIDSEVLHILERKCQSRDEREYLIGAAYYLYHHSVDFDGTGITLYKTIVEYNCKNYDGIGFFEPFQYWDGTAPTALAFVPQLPFGEKSHHDFGIFYSSEQLPEPKDWEFELAVEVDIHPSHVQYRSRDHYRDKLVSYTVLRLHSEDKPITWFKKVQKILANKTDNDCE
jgi:ssDNA-binding Zn-finger/Zn-ribbon topoisomerase 1